MSEKHANFVQASDTATAADVRAVMDAVRSRVAAATGYVLRSEVRLVGFDDETTARATGPADALEPSRGEEPR